MTRLLLLAALASGCSATLVPVRMDQPVKARVSIAPGLFTPPVEVTTPFVAQFEAGSMWPGSGFAITIELDADQAKRYGADHAIKLYGSLNIAYPMWPGSNQPLDVSPTEEDLRALISGEVPQITSYVVAEPHTAHLSYRERNAGHRKLASVTLRTTPFCK